MVRFRRRLRNILHASLLISVRVSVLLIDFNRIVSMRLYDDSEKNEERVGERRENRNAQEKWRGGTLSKIKTV